MNITITVNSPEDAAQAIKMLSALTGTPAPTAPAPAPAPTAPAPAPVPTAPTQAPAPTAPAPKAPVAQAPKLTLAEIQQAAGALLRANAGVRQELKDKLTQMGVVSLTMLPAEKISEFAEFLRQKGAAV